MPTARSSATGAVIDGRLYVAAGRRTDGGVTNLGALEPYDPKADAWTELRPLPQPSGGLAGAALDGTLYVFGGEYFSEDGGVYGHTWAYDPDTDTWANRPPADAPAWPRRDYFGRARLRHRRQHRCRHRRRYLIRRRNVYPLRKLTARLKLLPPLMTRRLVALYPTKPGTPH